MCQILDDEMRSNRVNRGNVSIAATRALSPRKLVVILTALGGWTAHEGLLS